MKKSKKVECGRWKILQGFTLIELIIVITIIAVLATLLMANLVGVRGRIRDGQRKSDLNQIKSVLELYRNDRGAYPTTELSTQLATTACGLETATLEKDGTVYLKKVPCDPLNYAPFVYTYSSDTATYTLFTCLENVNDSQKDPSSNPACSEGVSYTVTNP